MKNLFFSVLVILALGAVSCKKDNSSQPPAETVAKLKTWTDDYGVVNYTYDASGRLTKYEHLGGTKRTYDYQPGLVVEKYYNAVGNLASTKNLELDVSGYVIHVSDPNVPGTPTVKVYNADHQLVKDISVNGIYTNSMDYFYSNGNCDSMRYSTNGVWSETIKWTYYTDKANSFSNTNQGQAYWGNSSKNLMKSEQYFYAGGTQNDVSNYTYEFDAKGLVTKETITYGGNMSISYFTYY